MPLRWRHGFIGYFFGVSIILPPIFAVRQVRHHLNTGSSISGVTCAQDKGLGNADMYGIGVRIAAYIQVVVGLASTTPGAKRGALISNIAFLSAFTTALLLMLRNPSTETLDLYVVVILGNGLTMMMLNLETIPVACGGMLVSFIRTGSLDNYHSPSQAHRDATPRISSTFTEFQTVLMMLWQLLVLGLWKVCTTLFWWRTLPAAIPQPGCEIYGYFGARAKLESGALLHTFHKGLDIALWVYWFICVIVFLLNLHRLVRVTMAYPLPTGYPLPTDHRHWLPKSKLRLLLDLIAVFPMMQRIDEASITKVYRDASSQTPNNGSPGEVTRKAPRRARWIFVFLVMSGYYAMIQVEFVIAINRIPVNVVLQTGQLLPLVASICMLCAVVVDSFFEVFRKEWKEESSGDGGRTSANSPGVIQAIQMSR